jgi:hypothetical protein
MAAGAGSHGLRTCRRPAGQTPCFQYDISYCRVAIRVVQGFGLASTNDHTAGFFSALPTAEAANVLAARTWVQQGMAGLVVTLARRCWKLIEACLLRWAC